MSKNNRRLRTREKLKMVERQARTNKRKWKYGMICIVLFLASIIPYAIDLLRNPSPGKGILFLVLSVGGVVGIVLLTKYHDI